MLYIMRHGKTDWNAEHMLQGRTDIPLNEEGRQMAIDAREKYKDLHFNVCYCSPLKRARETAELLQEISFGEYEGIPSALLNPECPARKLFKEPENYVAMNGSESLESLFSRSGEFLKEIVQPELKAGKDVLIVAHGGLNCSIIAQYEHTPIANFWDNLQGNCELKKLE